MLTCDFAQQVLVLLSCYQQLDYNSPWQSLSSAFIIVGHVRVWHIYDGIRHVYMFIAFEVWGLWTLTG